MMEQHLSGMKARNGTTLFACITCKTAPTFTFGAQDNCEAVHVMLCPKCGIVLGEWSSIETAITNWAVLRRAQRRGENHILEPNSTIMRTNA